MGNSTSTQCLLKRREIKAFAEATHFTEGEVKALHVHYRTISSTRRDDGVIDRTEFQTALGFKDSVFLDRMFAVFDSDSDGQINFSEFINGLSILSNKAAVDEKLSFSFQIYDFDGDDVISREELLAMLNACLEENELVMTEAQLTALIDTTFAECEPSVPDQINATEFRALVERNPTMMSQMSLNISAIIAEHTAGHTIESAREDGTAAGEGEATK